VAQLSIALAIVVGALLWLYAVERIWFRQERARAIGIAFLVAGSDPAVGLILLVVLSGLIVPIVCFHVARRTIFGRHGAGTMQSTTFLRQVCLAVHLRVPNK
jgi:hypothetical protein